MTSACVIVRCTISAMTSLAMMRSCIAASESFWEIAMAAIVERDDDAVLLQVGETEVG